MFVRSVIVACLFAFAALAQVPCKWDAEASQASPASFSCYRGETLVFQPTFLEYGVTSTNATYTLHYQTNGMGTAYWSTNILQFTPAMDVGASAYTVFIRAETTNGISYRANAKIKMLGSPGATPNALPLPVASLDFSVTPYANAPWLASSAWLSWLSTNTYVKVESDPGIPAALVVASTNAQALASAAQANAISFASTNPVTRLTGTTNEWVQMVNGTATVYRVTYTNTAAYILLGYNNPNTPNGAPPSTYYRFASLTPIDFMPGMSRGDLGSEWILEVYIPEGYPSESYTAVYNPSYSIYWMTNNVTLPTLIPANQAYSATGYWVFSHEQVAVTNLYPLATTAQIPPAVDAVTNNQSAVSFSNVTATGSITLGGVGRSTWPESGGGNVASVFGRTGTVVATSGDYTAAQVGAYPDNNPSNYVAASALQGSVYTASNQTFTGVNTFNTNVTITAATLGTGVAPLVVKQTIPFGSPFTSYLMLLKDSTDANKFVFRANGQMDGGIGNFSSYVLSGLGSVSSPAFGHNAGQAGLYFPSSTQIGFMTSFTNRLNISTTAITATLPIHAPSFVFTNFAAGSFLWSNGTNLFFVNVNAVTNQLTAN